MAPLRRALLLLVVALSLARADGGEASVRLYEPASGPWSLSLQAPLQTHLGAGTPLDQIAGLKDGQRAAALGPVVYELQHSLRLTPEAFAQLTPAEQASALGMASEQAHENILQKSAELMGAAKTAAWSNRAVDREQLVALHALASRLQEIDRHYGAYFGTNTKAFEAAAATSAQASRRYLEARATYIGEFGDANAKALTQGGARAPPDGVDAKPSPRSPAFQPSPKARKLLERMKETKSGWGEKDLETVYVGYGFVEREGGKHTVYSHPRFPHLRTTVSRQNDLPPGYAQTAVKLIEELEALSAPAPIGSLPAAGETDLPPVPAPPAARASGVQTVPAGLAPLNR